MEQLVFSPKDLGMALQRQRKRLGLTQAEAGASFRVDQTTVSTVENGAPGTRLETLFRMLAALDLEMTISSKENNITKKSDEEDW